PDDDPRRRQGRIVTLARAQRALLLAEVQQPWIEVGRHRTVSNIAPCVCRSSDAAIGTAGAYLLGSCSITGLPPRSGTGQAADGNPFNWRRPAQRLVQSCTRVDAGATRFVATGP